MRKLFETILLSLAMISLAVSQASAQENRSTPTDDEHMRVKACVQTNLTTDVGPETCIGMIAAPCLETDFGKTRDGMLLCRHREGAIWLEMMWAEVRALADGMPEEILSELEGAQQSWATYQSQNCGLYVSLYGGMSRGWEEEADCLLEMTALRAIELNTLPRNW